MREVWEWKGVELGLWFGGWDGSYGYGRSDYSRSAARFIRNYGTGVLSTQGWR